MSSRNTRGYGVSRRSTAVYGWEGVEHAFDNFEDAKKYLLNVLANSQS